jgi:hypothetical protein
VEILAADSNFLLMVRSYRCPVDFSQRNAVAFLVHKILYMNFVAFESIVVVSFSYSSLGAIVYFCLATISRITL